MALHILRTYEYVHTGKGETCTSRFGVLAPGELTVDGGPRCCSGASRPLFDTHTACTYILGMLTVHMREKVCERDLES